MNSEFDKKLGQDFITNVPEIAGVYLFIKDDLIIYVGKAKNLKKRLGQYRMASRKKKDWKMRAIVREATKVEYRLCDSEKAALILENRLIQQYRPALNLAGAFAFLYPYLGYKSQPSHNGLISFCYTTIPEPMAEQGFALYGPYRSRDTVSHAYEALTYLMGFLGHSDQRERATYGSIPFTRIAVFRQLDSKSIAGFSAFLRGEDRGCLAQLTEMLLESVKARCNAAEVQLRLRNLKFFYDKEAHRLRLVLRHHGIMASRVPQQDRDALFIESGL